VFTFKTLTDQKQAGGTGKLMNVSFPGVPDYPAYRGKLLRLFGEPLHYSEYLEETFEYVIEATDAPGNIVILTAYAGASAPAIGARSTFQGGNDELNDLAARELIDLLNKTEPADFEAVGYYEDSDATMWYGVKNGEYFERSEPGKHIE
jgi:hypothetical protein